MSEHDTLRERLISANGNGTIAHRYLDRIWPIIQAELAALREPGPCGKHPKACYEVDMKIQVPSVGPGDELVGTLERHSCLACKELAARDATNAKLREVVKLLTTTGTSYNWGVLEKASALLAEGDK